MLRSITTAANSAINQSEVLAITRNLPKAREKLRVQGAIEWFWFCFTVVEKLARTTHEVYPSQSRDLLSLVISKVRYSNRE